MDAETMNAISSGLAIGYAAGIFTGVLATGYICGKVRRRSEKRICDDLVELHRKSLEELADEIYKARN